MTTFTLPELPYAYNALEPFMSSETLEFHHDKHHNAYLVKMLEIIAGTEYESMSLDDIITKSHKDNPGLFNQAGQFYNHNLFWLSMAPNGGESMPAALKDKIIADFGSVEDFRTAFIQNGVGQFGSGWVWLVKDNQTNKLEIMKTLNADTPIVHGKTPLLVCDVWEHSYYIDYRNARPKYLETWFDKLANWDYAAKQLG